MQELGMLFLTQDILAKFNNVAKIVERCSLVNGKIKKIQAIEDVRVLDECH